MKWLGITCALVTAIIASCSKESDNGGRSSCVPGEVNECPGPNGCDGTQECSDDGRYGACVCDGDSGGSGGGGSGDAGAGADEPGGSGTTAGTSTGASSGRSGGSGGSPGGSGGSPGGSGGAPNIGGFANMGGVPECTPEDVSNFEPPTYVPARLLEGACTDEEILDFHDNCLMTGPVSGSSCAEFEPGGSSAECGACIAPTTVDASSRGPLIEFVVNGIQQWVTNNAGCIELMGAQDCAEQMQAAWECTYAACSTCPTTDWGTTEPYAQCTLRARSGDCAELDVAARCIPSSAMNEACSGGSFRDQVLELGLVFCG